MSYDEFKKIEKKIVSYAPITFRCRNCGRTETMTKNRLMLRPNLFCTKCASDMKKIEKFGSIEKYLEWRNNHQVESFQ